MKIVFIGLPGTGKGTQAKNIEDHLGIHALSTGDMLRAMKKEPGPLGDEVRAIPLGTFASDDLILRALHDRVNNEPYTNGIVLDGFPRTQVQAQKMLEDLAVPDLIVNFDMPTSLLAERITGRRVHPASGRSYHVVYNPPKVADIDDITGEPLITRPDDTVEVLQRRIRDHETLTLPALYYLQAALPERVLHVDASKSIAEVWECISQRLASLQPAKADNLTL